MLSVRESRSRNQTSPRKWPRRPEPADRQYFRAAAPDRSGFDDPMVCARRTWRASAQASKERRIMPEAKYRRVVVKLSGEYLAGDQPFGIHQPTIDRIAGDLIEAHELGVELAVVVGGGNIFRGVEVSARGVSRA